MQIGIVILNYNCIDQTKELLNTIINIEIINNIVIVDNNSRDDIDSLKELSSKIICIKNNINSGYAAGNNVGFKYLIENTNCEIGFLANPDCLLNKEVIENVSDFLSIHQNYLIASSLRKDVQFGEYTTQFWKLPTYFVTLLEGFFIYQRIHDKKERKVSNGLCNSTKQTFLDVEVVPGSFFGINLKLYNKIGMMDEDTFLWYEENCLGQKAKIYNHKEAILLNCSYIHNHKIKKKGKTLYSKYIKSKEFYCRKYLKLGRFKYSILKIFDFISLIEHKSLNFIARVLKK